MNTEAEKRVLPEPDLKARVREIERLERLVTVFVSDNDYRSVYLPCLPMAGPIDHWR
jgi:hypothetical protein